MRFAATTVFIAALAAAYVAMSGGLPYLPASATVDYGFYIGNWPGLVTYSFVHVGPVHLIGNLVVLAAAGFVAERKLRLRDFSAMFFLTGAAAAAFFALLEPSTILVGASAAISGILVGAFFIDFKRALVIVPAAIIISSVFIAPAVNSEVAGYYDQLNVTSQHLSIALNQTLEREQVLRGQLETGNITVEQFEQESLVINETKKNVTGQLVSALNAKNNIESGRERERESTVSSLSHVVGVLVGFAYLAAFRRDIVRGVPDQLAFISRLKRRKHDLKPRAKATRMRTRRPGRRAPPKGNTVRR